MRHVLRSPHSIAKADSHSHIATFRSLPAPIMAYVLYHWQQSRGNVIRHAHVLGPRHGILIDWSIDSIVFTNTPPRRTRLASIHSHRYQLVEPGRICDALVSTVTPF